jgi:hypothetical protein
MKPLLAKEIRLLLPAYATALILAVAPLWLYTVFTPFHPQPEISIYPLFFGAAMLALSVFGREFGLKTFPLLLAQPLVRKRIWLTKIAVLAGAMASLYVTWYLALLVFCREWRDQSDWLQVPAVGGLMLAIAFSGGLWTTLLLRQVAAAFWFTIGVPVAILTIIGLSGGNGWIASIALGLYSVAGFWMAWRLFFRAQEAAWTGGVITFPGRRTADAASQPSIRVYRPVAALFWKELHLHQGGLAGMGGLFVMHLGVVALRKTVGDDPGSVLESFGGIWLIAPLLVGCSSVAEERKLGVLEDHLCRPISRRVQFAIKLFFVLVLGGLLSAALFWTAEGIASAVGPNTPLGFSNSVLWLTEGIRSAVSASGYVGVIKMSFDGATLALMSFIFLTLALIGFYASTLARSIVHALTVAVVTAITVWMCSVIVSRRMVISGFHPWGGALGPFIAWLTLVAAFVWLAYRNFRCVSESSRLWRRNILGLIVALVFIFDVTSVLNHLRIASIRHQFELDKDGFMRRMY